VHRERNGILNARIEPGFIFHFHHRNDVRAKIKTTPQGAGKGGAFFIAFRRLGREEILNQKEECVT